MSLSEKLPQALWLRIHLLLPLRTHGGGVSFKADNFKTKKEKGQKLQKLQMGNLNFTTGKALEQPQNTVGHNT